MVLGFIHYNGKAVFRVNRNLQANVKIKIKKKLKLKLTSKVNHIIF